MAKKKNRADASQSALQTHIEALNAWLPGLDDGSAEGLFAAVSVFHYLLEEFRMVGLIGELPLQGEPAEMKWARDEIVRCHARATHIVMRHAELLGIDSTPLAASAKLYRDLLERNPDLFRKREVWLDPAKHQNEVGCQVVASAQSVPWPDCLGDATWELPEHQQEIIRHGEATLARLMLKAGIRRVTPRNDIPTPQDVENVRKVMDSMGIRNPSVRAVRSAVKSAGYSLSNAKISGAMKKIRGE